MLTVLPLCVPEGVYESCARDPPSRPAKLTAPVRWFRPRPNWAAPVQYVRTHCRMQIQMYCRKWQPADQTDHSPQSPKLRFLFFCNHSPTRSYAPSSRHGSAVNSSAHWLFIHFKCSDIADLWLFYLGKKAMVDQPTDRPTDMPTDRALSVRRRRLHLAGFLGKQCSAGHQ